MDIQLFQHCLRKYLTEISNIFVKNELSISIWIYFSTLFSSIALYVYSPSTTLSWYCCFTVGFEIRLYKSPNFIFRFKNCFGSYDLMEFLFVFYDIKGNLFLIVVHFMPSNTVINKRCKIILKKMEFFVMIIW